MSDNDYRLYGPEELGKDGYPAAWSWIKHEVRERAGHRCVRCGHPYQNGEHGNGEWSACDELCTHGGPLRSCWKEGDEVRHGPEWSPTDGTNAGTLVKEWMGRGWIEARWRILTVHHLSGSKSDCRWFNLAALDQRCHLQIQGKVKMERVWPWEHSSWFRPYVAGYYAWTYLKEELSREEVEARMDELLALERMA